MEKKIIAIIKLAITSGKATPAPPIGPALGQHGLNIMNFCKEYNTRTRDKGDLIIPVEISAYEDRSFSFILKTSPASILLKKVVNINKGSSQPNKIIIAHVTNFQLEEIANIKMQDLNTKNLITAKKIIEGTAKNMGIQISK